jgi:hypothetical protein
MHAVIRHRELGLPRAAAAVIGTSEKPRPSAVFDHRTTRSITTGHAVANPTAMPFWRARPSSFASARSISTAEGTASSTRFALAKPEPPAPAIRPARLLGEVPSST